MQTIREIRQDKSLYLKLIINEIEKLGFKVSKITIDDYHYKKVYLTLNNSNLVLEDYTFKQIYNKMGHILNCYGMYK